MATLENSMETVPCPHCGSPVRPGMIRCRECGNLLTEADDFVLSPQIAAPAQPKCPRCEMLLEPGIDDCPSCASALLDDLMKGPAQSAMPPVPQGESAEPSSASAELRSRQAATPVRPPASSWTPLPEVEPANAGSEAKKADRPQPRRSQPPQKPSSPAKSKAPAKSRSTIEDDPPGLFDDDDTATPPPRTEPSRTVPATSPVPAGKSSPAGAAVETSAACAALLASLATADATLRIGIVEALGKLGDKAALGPLEPHLVDQDIRVRRAVAAALVQLGHPKGQTLLDVAERKPAADVLSASKASAAPKPKPRQSGGGMSIDGGAVMKIGVAVVAIAVVGGGIWYWMNSRTSGPTRKPRKPKSSTTRKVSEGTTPARHHMHFPSSPRDEVSRNSGDDVPEFTLTFCSKPV